MRAHRLAVDVLRAGPGDFPVGLTVSMAEITATEGGEALRDAAEEMLENIFLRATEGDDFVGVQCYTRMHFGPERAWPPTILRSRSPKWATSAGPRPSSTRCGGRRR